MTSIFAMKRYTVYYNTILTNGQEYVGPVRSIIQKIFMMTEKLMLSSWIPTAFHALSLFGALSFALIWLPCPQSLQTSVDVRWPAGDARWSKRQRTHSCGSVPTSFDMDSELSRSQGLSAQVWLSTHTAVRGRHANQWIAKQWLEKKIVPP